MTVIESIFLGLLQGLTEFLPISSSGHLILAQRLFDIDATLFFDVMLHIGTLVAVIITFRKSIVQVFTTPLKSNKKLLYLVVASVPTFAIAFVAKFILPDAVLDGALLPIGFAVTIVLLTLSKFLSRPRLRFENAGIASVVVTGIVQGIAVVPGLSRSGSTISTLRLFGVENTDSGEFSFLLSIPVILASGVVEGIEALNTTITTPWYCIVIGIVTAFFSGYVAVKTVMRVLKKDYWLYFAIYLLIPLTISLLIL